LRGRDGREIQNAGSANQQLRVLDDAVAFEDRWQQLFLNVNDDQRALGGIEGSTTAPIGTRAGSAVFIPATARLTRQARNAPMKYEASSNRNVCRSS